MFLLSPSLYFALMSQPRPFHSNNSVGGQYNDTTFTKIFVGGLAWETQRHTMRRFFEQFGEILEAVVITDKNTGRSKGYGFVSVPFPLPFFLCRNGDFIWCSSGFFRSHLRILMLPLELVKTLPL